FVELGALTIELLASKRVSRSGLRERFVAAVREAFDHPLFEIQFLFAITFVRIRFRRRALHGRCRGFPLRRAMRLSAHHRRAYDSHDEREGGKTPQSIPRYPQVPVFHRLLFHDYSPAGAGTASSPALSFLGSFASAGARCFSSIAYS